MQSMEKTFLLLCFPTMLLVGQVWALGRQVAPRDAFPVFDNPPMLTAAEAEKQGVVFKNDAVIGVEHEGVAKAYPVAVMGVHELGNDTLGDLPVAVGW